MNQGDIVVCGVSRDVVIEDIPYNVPQATAVRIPGDLAQKSKDLWRYLSQGVIFRCDVSNIVGAQAQKKVDPPVVQPDLQGKVDELQQEVTQLRGVLTRAQLEAAQVRAGLETEIGKLQAEKALLRSELAEERAKFGQLGKLDDILTLLQKQPRSALVALPSNGSNGSVEEAAPRYIPSQIKSDAELEVPVSVQEAQSDSGTVAGAAQALRSVRKRGQ